MAKRTDKALDAWLRHFGVNPKMPHQTRDVFARIYSRYVALRRTDFVRLLNAETVVALRRAEAGKDRITTGTTVEKWVEAGCPVNEDGTVTPLEICAWLAAERKDAGGGRNTLARKAGKAGGAPAGDGLDALLAQDELVSQMRTCVEGGDVVGLIGLLMRACPNLETAEAVSKITMNIIGAEKGRVKAQADEYERKLRSGELLEKGEVEKGRLDRCRFIRETLEGLGSFAPRLQGKELVDIRKELEAIGGKILENLSS